MKSCKQNNSGEGAGRKWFDGKDEGIVIAKLEACWAIGASDAEAAFYADILPSTLCRYLEKHPEIAQRKEMLKERPILLARQAVIASFDGHEVEQTDSTGKPVIDRETGKPKKTKAFRDPDLAMKYLERKKRAEFATKVESENVGDKPIKIVFEKAPRSPYADESDDPGPDDDAETPQDAPPPQADTTAAEQPETSAASEPEQTDATTTDLPQADNPAEG